MAIKLQTNIPQTFELEFPEGLSVSSKFGGDQVMFTLTNGERWYCDPFIAQKIKAAGIGAYTPFNITKREITQGNRRRVEYEIEALKEPQTITDARPTVHAHEHYNGQTTAVVLGAGASVNGFEDRLKAAMGAPAVAAPAPSSVAVMKLAGIGAIDAVLEIEKYAQSRGMVDFNFGADNIQKLTACLFIEMSKKAGRA
jgi:hypothetical protein